MDKIICLVGESGSGKTTLCKELEKEGYNIIKSYTTRKPRYEGEYGHIFVSYKDFFNATIENEFEENDMIAYTFFDKEHYWAIKGQYQGKGTSIYVIDVAGVKELKEKVKDAEIVVIYLKADEEECFKRMIKRAEDDYTMTKIGYDKVIDKIEERIKHDREAFKIVKCDYCIGGNRHVKDILKDVKLIIDKYEL